MALPTLLLADERRVSLAAPPSSYKSNEALPMRAGRFETESSSQHQAYASLLRVPPAAPCPHACTQRPQVLVTYDIRCLAGCSDWLWGHRERGLTGVGHRDLIDLIGIQPDLPEPTRQHGCGKPLLKLERHHGASTLGPFWREFGAAAFLMPPDTGDPCVRVYTRVWPRCLGLAAHNERCGMMARPMAQSEDNGPVLH